MAEFLKGKSTENAQFLKSASADPERPTNSEYKKLRGLANSKSNGRGNEKTGHGNEKTGRGHEKTGQGPGFVEGLMAKIRLMFKPKHSDSP